MEKIARKILLAAAAAVAAIAANADSFIYWQASDSMKSLFYNLDVDYASGSLWYGQYNYATQTKGSGEYLVPVVDGTPSDVDVRVGKSFLTDDATPWTFATTSTSDKTFSAGNFFVFELYLDGGVQLGYLAREYGWDGFDFIYNSASGLPSGASAYELTGIVPEPSSGLLALLGMGVIALRRKKRG